jgi:hypothetical protein
LHKVPNVPVSALTNGPYAEQYKPVLAALATVQDALGQADVGAQLLKEEVADFNLARTEMFKLECEKRGLQYCGKDDHLVHASPGEMVFVYVVGKGFHDGGSYGSDHEYVTFKIVRTCPDCRRKCLEEAAASTSTQIYQARPAGDGGYEYLDRGDWRAADTTSCSERRHSSLQVEPQHLEAWEDELGFPPMLASSFQSSARLVIKKDASVCYDIGVVVDDYAEVGTEE